MSKQDWRKLQAYIASGLTPEECCRLRDENRKLREMAILPEVAKEMNYRSLHCAEARELEAQG